jgi:hypothetical protein
MQIIHDFELLGRNTGDARDGLRALQAQGIGGIVTNMPFENYMQDPAVWGRLREFLGACRSMGLRVWLYDEKGYPSGYAGGQVLARRPDLEARALYCDAAEGRFTEDRSYEGTHNCNNYYAKARTPNLLEPEAIAEFIRVTHDRYAAELGPDLAVVEAFFTDEPALNAIYFPEIPAARGIPVLDPPDAQRKQRPGVAWSARLAERFGQRDLTGLFVDRAGAGALREEFYGQVGETLARNCFGQLQEWCHAHGVQSSGHLLWEEDAAYHVPLYGNFLRCLMRLDIPGIDVLSATPLRGCQYSRRGAVLAMSAALLNGTRRIFSESSDFVEQMNEKRVASPAEAAAALAWQAALGVTDFTYYFSFGRCRELSGTSGEEFLPADQPRLFRTPAEYLAINTAISGILERLAPAELEADVFLYYPVELLQAAYCPAVRPWEPGAKSPELVRIANAFHDALGGLLDAGVIPCLVDGGMLREMREGDDAGKGVPRYQVGRAMANAIVFPAGCEPAGDCRPAVHAECHAFGADLPKRLHARGLTRILKDNPEVCAGVMRQGDRSVLTLVNLTDRPQTCAVQSRAGGIEKRLDGYQSIVEWI